VGLLIGANWLTEQPTDGGIEADSTLDIDVNVKTKGLVDGDYQATIFVASNDPDEPEVSVPVSLHVTGVPGLAVSPDTLDYGEVFIGVTAKDTLIVSNAGTALLSITGISSDRAEFVADTAKFDLAPGKQQAVVITFRPDTTLAFSGGLTITSNDPQRPSVTVALAGKGVIPPAIAVAPDSLRADLFTGNAATQVLKMYNHGGSDLAFNISIENTAATAASRQNPSADLSAASFSSRARREWPKHLVNAQPGPQAPANSPLIRNVMAAALPIVVEDSTGDGFEVDLTILRGASTFKELQIEMEFSTRIDSFNFVGFLSLDLDQNPKTGRAPSVGLPTQDIGVEYEFSFFSLSSGRVDLFSAIGAFIGSYPVKITTHTLSFSTPLADLGNDDGKMDVTGVVGIIWSDRLVPGHRAWNHRRGPQLVVSRPHFRRRSARRFRRNSGHLQCRRFAGRRLFCQAAYCQQRSEGFGACRSRPSSCNRRTGNCGFGYAIELWRRVRRCDGKGFVGGLQRRFG
jgi:hypothetical protein